MIYVMVTDAYDSILPGPFSAPDGSSTVTPEQILEGIAYSRSLNAAIQRVFRHMQEIGVPAIIEHTDIGNREARTPVTIEMRNT